MKHGQKLGHLFGGAAVALTLFASGTSARAELALSEVPLFLAAGAEPNVMLMLDNSGSMQNIVPDEPYDAGTVYLSACPSTSLVDSLALSDRQVLLSVSSGSPRIRVGGNDFVYGTDSGELCFDSNKSYTAKLNTDGISSYLPATYSGNYLNWYFDAATDPASCSNTWDSGRKPCTQSRMSIAKTAGWTLVDLLPSAMRAGLATYDDDSSSGGQLLEPVGDLTSSKRTELQSEIAALSPSGMTPLAETLSDIGYYFSRGASDLTLHPDTNPQTQSRANIFSNGYARDSSWDYGSDPVMYSCQKSFAVMLTDGRPQGDREISSYLSDYDGDCADGTCLSYDMKADQQYESQGSDYLDDVAMALYEMDLRPDLVSSRGIKNNVASYFITFADNQAINDPLMPRAAEQGGGQSFVAGNEAQLKDAFRDAFSSIIEQTTSASAVATNSTRLDTDTLVYQARFRSDDWTGQLLAYPLQADGSLGAARWDAATVLPAPSSRNILTRSGSVPGAGGGADFLWANLDASQQAALNLHPDGTTDNLGEQRVAWLRGDQSNEQQANGPFRNRSVALGDIVNSDPIFAGGQNFGYEALPVGTAGQDTYIAFRQSRLDTNGKIKKPMIYVGANDGMLHAFDGATGEERFAYVPSTAIPSLNQLTSPAYGHRYYVDGQIFVGDAYLNRAGVERWASVLVGTTGAGGRTVFALDVTDPHAVDAADVMWEFTDPDLGYTIGQPLIARMADGTWVAVFGNGYNSDNHRAVLFIVDLENGTLLRKIDTGIGDATTPNGLATPALLPDGTRTIQAVYAGDLRGNLWKFNVSHPNSGNWDAAYKSGTQPQPLFVATDASGVAQPITAPVEIGRHPEGGYMVFFGTGKFIENGDNIVGATPQVQTFYGIWDKPGGGAITTGRSALQEQEILKELEPSNSEFEVRVTSNVPVVWSSKRGWYLDLVSPVHGAQGERVVASPILRDGRIIFPTLIPSQDPCGFGGTSWLMEIDAVSGVRLQLSPLDITGDGKIDGQDLVTVEIDGETIAVPVSAVRSREGIIRTPAVVSAGQIEYKLASGTSGNVETLLERGLFDRARGSWRQIR